MHQFRFFTIAPVTRVQHMQSIKEKPAGGKRKKIQAGLLTPVHSLLQLITTPDAVSAHAKFVEHPLETYFCPMDKN